MGGEVGAEPVHLKGGGCEDEECKMNLREKLAILLEEIRGLNEKDTLTDEEKELLDGKLTEAEETRASIEREDRAAELDKFSKPEVADEKPEFRAGDKIEVKGRREAKRSYANLGEQIVDIRAAQFDNDSSAKERLVNVNAEHRAISGMSTVVPSDGGYLVQTDFASEILTKVHDTAKLPGKCRPVTISNSSNAVKIPYIDETSRADGSRAGGVRGYWTAEGGGGTASAPKLGEIELSLKKLTVLSYLTEELMADASAMGSILSREVPQEIGFKFDDAIFRGDGAGKPIGLLNALCKVEVAKEAGQTADTVVWENVANMYAQLWSGSASSAEWYINQNILPQLYSMALAVGTGGAAVYLPPGGASVSPYGSLMGRPVNIIEQASTLGDAGDIVLADLSEYYWATKGGIDAASSIHVRFLYGETTLRWTVRVDGQSAWHSALTPYKDAGTTKPVSPIITLAERA